MIFNWVTNLARATTTAHDCTAQFAEILKAHPELGRWIRLLAPHILAQVDSLAAQAGIMRELIGKSLADR